MVSEKQLMLTGEPYLASDPELTAEHLLTRQRLRLYNSSAPDAPEQRLAILQELLGMVGPKVEIEPPFYCDYGSNIYAGDNLYLNFGCVILDCAPVRIGSNVMMGPTVQIYAATHPVGPVQRRSGRELAFPIHIGNDVWIGGGAIIGPGVTIGDNTTIGAGSVVMRSIPAGVVAAGNPCRVIREIS